MERNKTLEQIGTELPFKVPENYFEQFATQFEETIATKETRHIALRKKWMSIAAMFIGILVLGQLLYKLYDLQTVNKHDNYEAYVLMQVDEASLVDCYVTNSSK
jgi:hypothetical protein